MSLIRYGTDTSGRPILATTYAQRWLDAFIKACQNAHRTSGGRVKNFTPVIVQGAFMATIGGGAKASAGYHDQAGCYDFRVWDLAPEQASFMVRTARRMAGAAWTRDAAHGGMDPHCHVTLGGDSPKAPGASFQWSEYLAGRDGLAGRGKDYLWRPSPLVRQWAPTPPARTPNITAALAAKTVQGRKAALRLVIDHNPKAAPAARKWLTAILNAEAASKRLTATRAAAQRDLRSLEAA